MNKGDKIIDISRWQPKVEWVKVKSTDVKGVIIKATQGVNGKDEKTRSHAEGAYSVGLPIGYYHFASLNDKDEVGDATAEAKWFAYIVKSLPSPQLGVWLDLEDNTAKLTPVEVLAWVNTFFAELEKQGIHDCGLYSGKYFLNQNLPKGHGLGARKLWHAGYTKTISIADGWTEATLWQYTDKGVVDGIAGGVDTNKVIKPF